MSPRVNTRMCGLPIMASALVLATLGVLPASAAPTNPDPDPVALMSEYDNYWTPFAYDKSDPSTGFRGDVLDAAILGSSEIPDWTDPATGLTHTGSYQSMADDISQAFPSGHTTHAYSVGFALAAVLPELASEAITRSSEAGDNRIVLGVHYPLDVMGGRILGEAGVAHLLSDPDYVENTFKSAQTELADYLASRCAADGQGATLTACIDAVDASDAGGYTNAFTDVVSALTAYEARMTYNFGQIGTKGQTARVLEGAEGLLVTAFPTLTSEQRREVLAATEIDSGYLLDSSSEGWQRLNLVAAASSKVTLDQDGAVVDVEPGQSMASIVTEEPTPEVSPTPSPAPSETSPVPVVPVPSDSATPKPMPSIPSPTQAFAVKAGKRSNLAHTGADLAVIIPVVVALLIAGRAVTIILRRQAKR